MTISFNHLGRLGYLANQMFQYAAIKGIAANNNIDYMIPEDNEMQLFDGFYMSTVTDLRGFLGDINRRDGRGAPIGCNIVMEKGFEFDEELFTNPPKNTSPTLKPVKITSSPGLKFSCSLFSTTPLKSIPGMCGNSSTSLAPFFKINASL